MGDENHGGKKRELAIEGEFQEEPVEDQCVYDMEKKTGDVITQRI